MERFRKDYAPPPYFVDSLKLNFIIDEEETLVESALSIEPAASTVASEPMFLDGEELALRSIELDGTPLVEGVDYTLTGEGLTLLAPPLASFTLSTTVAIKPQENTQLSGLYKSSGNFVTQARGDIRAPQAWRAAPFAVRRPRGGLWASSSRPLLHTRHARRGGRSRFAAAHVRSARPRASAASPSSRTAPT